VHRRGNGSCATASFAGVDQRDGHLWVYLETIGGGSGARAGKDWLDGVHVHMTNTSNLPVEALEVEYPLTVLEALLAARFATLYVPLAPTHSKA